MLEDQNATVVVKVCSWCFKIKCKFSKLNFKFLEKDDGMEIKKQGTEIGKVMAEKSHGLFSADDWQCKTLVVQCFFVLVNPF